MIRRPQRPPLFPSTPLSRSLRDGAGPDDRCPPLDRRSRPEDPGRREDPLHAALLHREALLLLLRAAGRGGGDRAVELDRKSTRLNSSHSQISYAVFCLTKNT